MRALQVFTTIDTWQLSFCLFTAIRAKLGTSAPPVEAAFLANLMCQNGEAPKKYFWQTAEIGRK